MNSESTGCWRRQSLVIMPLSALIASLLLLNLFGLPVSRSTPQCKAGDAACFCRAVGGTWLATPTTIHPTCRKVVNFKGDVRALITLVNELQASLHSEERQCQLLK